MYSTMRHRILVKYIALRTSCHKNNTVLFIAIKKHLKNASTLHIRRLRNKTYAVACTYVFPCNTLVYEQTYITYVFAYLSILINRPSRKTRIDLPKTVTVTFIQHDN